MNLEELEPRVCLSPPTLIAINGPTQQWEWHAATVADTPPVVVGCTWVTTSWRAEPGGFVADTWYENTPQPSDVVPVIVAQPPINLHLRAIHVLSVSPVAGGQSIINETQTWEYQTPVVVSGVVGGYVPLVTTPYDFPAPIGVWETATIEIVLNGLATVDVEYLV